MKERERERERERDAHNNTNYVVLFAHFLLWYVPQLLHWTWVNMNGRRRGVPFRRPITKGRLPSPNVNTAEAGLCCDRAARLGPTLRSTQVMGEY